MDRLIDFAASVPEFRRTDKGNHRHRLSDVIILIVLARASGRVGRADMIEFGRHNLKRFRSMRMLGNGVPSEATLCRIEQGMDDVGVADEMTRFIGYFHDRFIGQSGEPEVICIDGKAMRGTVLENGRNPDIVSAYSYNHGLTLDTEACGQKSNEIKAVPVLLDRLNFAGKTVTADAMSMQKKIVDTIRNKNGDFLIELKANQRSLRYGIEDKVRHRVPVCTITDGPSLEHGRIETRTYRIFDGLDMIADKEKWGGGNLTVVEFQSETIRKSTGMHTTERRLYVSSHPVTNPFLGDMVRHHWSIESMHWNLDRNFRQDRIKRKTPRAARNLDTLQRVALSLFSIWRGCRKKLSDKKKGVAALMRGISVSFTKLIRFLSQK